MRIEEGPRTLYRVAKRKYDPADPTGARIRGARWSSPGRDVLYCAECEAGAILEILAHLGHADLPGPHHALRLELPGGIPIERVEPADVPGWDAANRTASRAYGDRWYDEGRTLVLVVPSVPARPFGKNVLLNASHPEYRRIRSGPPVPVPWDDRVMRPLP